MCVCNRLTNLFSARLSAATILGACDQHRHHTCDELLPNTSYTPISSCQLKPKFRRVTFCERVMSRTSELLKLPGVVAAALFSRKGYLEESEGALSEAEAVEMVNLCAAITMTMEMQGRLLGRMVDQSGWNSCYGWMMWGPDMSIVTIHDSMCIVQGRQVSFNQLIKAMTESAEIELIKPGGKGEQDASIG
jgi:roadblock/LC7 domain-containing protein